MKPTRAIPNKTYFLKRYRNRQKRAIAVSAERKPSKKKGNGNEVANVGVNSP